MDSAHRKREKSPKTTSKSPKRGEIDQVVYSWGAHQSGQLGLGTIEEEQVTKPRQLTTLPVTYIFYANVNPNFHIRTDRGY